MIIPLFCLLTYNDNLLMLMLAFLSTFSKFLVFLTEEVIVFKKSILLNSKFKKNKLKFPLINFKSIFIQKAKF